MCPAAGLLRLELVNRQTPLPQPGVHLGMKAEMKTALQKNQPVSEGTIKWLSEC